MAEFLYLPGIFLNGLVTKLKFAELGGFSYQPKVPLPYFLQKQYFLRVLKKNLLYRSIQQRKRGGKRGKKINLEFLITAIPRMVVTFGCWTFGLGPNYLTTSQLSLTSHEPMQDWALIERDLPLLGAILYTTRVLSLD